MVDFERIHKDYKIVDRKNEVRLALAALKAQKNLLLEGPVGVGKTTLATAIAKFLGKPIFRIDGDERYNEQKLTGWFDPPLVLKIGYADESFSPGPLTQAMQAGGILFINEMNRMPESVQNVLLPALDEKLTIIPRIGRIQAEAGFQVIATQNPQEFVATTNLSEALRDRFELIRLDYQSFEDEIKIVEVNTSLTDREIMEGAVLIVRATRVHPKVKRGASIRAAISIAQIAYELGGQEGLLEAAMLALPTRIELKEDTLDKNEDIIEQIVNDVKKKESQDQDQKAKEEPSESEGDAEKAKPSKKTVGVDELEKYFSRLKEADDKSWRIAEEYHRVKSKLPHGELRKQALQISVKAVLEKASAILGANKPKAKMQMDEYVRLGYGELEIEETVENILGKDMPERNDIIVSNREEKRMDVALMLDTSLSMTGKKLAWAGVAAAVLAKKLNPKDMAIILFESSATVVKHIDHHVSPDWLVGKILNIPATGYTNIEDALKKGLRELSYGSKPEKVGILVTDGKYTEGGYPLPWAAKYKRLYVLMTEDYNIDEDLCRKMADQGGGKAYSVKRYEDLPYRLHRILSEILR
jgi:MoxR-like ATPase